MVQVGKETFDGKGSEFEVERRVLSWLTYEAQRRIYVSRQVSKA
jgi:hypothetical protein